MVSPITEQMKIYVEVLEYRAKKVLFLLFLIQERSRKKFTFGALDESLFKELLPVERSFFKHCLDWLTG